MREKDFCKLQQKIAQLRAAIQKLKETINAWDKATWFECPRCGSIRDTLTTITKIIGGAQDGSCKNK
jgi:transcription elongation factor Elf1